jgi:hypothetical protein
MATATHGDESAVPSRCSLAPGSARPSYRPRGTTPREASAAGDREENVMVILRFASATTGSRLPSASRSARCPGKSLPSPTTVSCCTGTPNSGSHRPRRTHPPSRRSPSRWSATEHAGLGDVRCPVRDHDGEAGLLCDLHVPSTRGRCDQIGRRHVAVCPHHDREGAGRLGRLRHCAHPLSGRRARGQGPREPTNDAQGSAGSLVLSRRARGALPS